ncbi:uroporphyrinogen-III synthase [Celeribacter sp.]|uniref:uroporphyrinogen-III synthase n=1 Tax=Celeribacter sp. TaxID=1890673 RepID=UPI003A920DD9
MSAARDNLDVIIAPVMEITSVEVEDVPAPPELVLLTSRHAVNAAATLFPDVPVLCVGDATAESAHAKGLKATSVAGTSVELVEDVLRRDCHTILHLHGAHTRGDVTERLRRAGRAADERVVYEQNEVKWTDDAKERIDRSETLIVPLFSPRNAVTVGARLRGFAPKPLHLVSMSRATNDAWSGVDPVTRTCADHPDFASMVRAIGSQVG